jgi:hypothetical protein
MTERQIKCQICCTDRDQTEFFGCIGCPCDICLFCFPSLDESKCPHCQTLYDPKKISLSEDDIDLLELGDGCNDLSISYLRLFVDKIINLWKRLKGHLVDDAVPPDVVYIPPIIQLNSQFVQSTLELVDDAPDDFGDQLNALYDQYQSDKQQMMDEHTYEFAPWPFIREFVFLHNRVLSWGGQPQYSHRPRIMPRLDGVLCIGEDPQMRSLVMKITERVTRFVGYIASCNEVVYDDMDKVERLYYCLDSLMERIVQTPFPPLE